MSAKPPKKPAKKPKAKPPAEQPSSWAADLAARLGGSPVPSLPDPGQPMGPREMAPVALMSRMATADREFLESWWRDHMALVTRVIEERARLLATADTHPSEVFANQVMRFGAMGIPADVAATLLGMSEGQMRLHYGREYAMGSAEIVAMAAQSLIRIANSTNDRYAVKALTELLNRRGGDQWRAPAQKLEVRDDRAARSSVIDSSKLSYEDRQALKAIVERAVNGQVINAGLIAGRTINESDGEDS